MAGHPRVSPTLLRGVDRAAFAVALADRLRHAGVPAGLTDVDIFVRALAVSPPVRMSTLYWTARISLVRQHTHLAAFDRVFAAVFADAPPLPLTRSASPPGARDDVHLPVPADTDTTGPGGGLPWATLPAAVAETAGSEADLRLPERRPAALAGLADRPFEELESAQVDLLGDALRAAVARWPTRRTRRHTMGPAGRRVALRPTIARARRTAWEPVEVVRERPVRRPRRVVLLCDVSESMRAQATAYLHLLRAFAVVTDAEVFAFATTLTRLTIALRHASATAAIAQASAAVPDRFGGTRIATNLRALLASHHGDAVRGAVVVIGSDGWDSDPPGELAAVMARLRRRAYRIVWLNPRAGAPGFAPRVAGMAAALPYCDVMLPAGTFRDLLDAARQLHNVTCTDGLK
ncbi:VWA domain-containing protein [Micromonospora sp. WMMD812]|uniref:vWA domain-containing protein n=1 Tax=Micromonospora sp. WMMD812 TaxID=3015152 RepID=UPI00248BB053|nr:VWA domain-containing protein [Micromonospora sp. WMMD812]WBB68286.1 VWA domain-containing protein [Micromonospora sp. WMMD812]